MPCLAMIEAGKHVLVEKPLTTDIAEARAIIAAAERANVKLMVDSSCAGTRSTWAPRPRWNRASSARA